jgi:hypothetical protein
MTVDGEVRGIWKEDLEAHFKALCLSSATRADRNNKHIFDDEDDDVGELGGYCQNIRWK